MRVGKTSDHYVVALIALAAALVLGTTDVEAAAELPCTQPFVFDGAAVNMAILQYTYEGPGGRKLSEAAQQLSRLIHLDTLFALAKYGNIGVVHLVFPRDTEVPCRPEVVVDQMLGNRPGAAPPVKPSHGLVFLWGRIYEEAGDLYVQTHLQFFRRGVVEQLRLQIPVPQRASIDFLGRLPSQAVAFAPRRLTAADLQSIARNFKTSAVVRDRPDDAAPGQPMDFALEAPFAYFIETVKEDGWVKIQPMSFGQQGWIHARIDPQLRRKLPELSFVDAVVGYLMYRIGTERVPGLSAPPPQTVRWALETLAQYEQSENGSGVPPEPFPIALGKTLDGVLQVLETGAVDRATVPEAAGQAFTAAATLIPYNASAWNLKAMADIYRCCRTKPSEVSPTQALQDLFNGIATEPRNADVLENLENFYLLLQSPAVPRVQFDRAELARRLQDVRAVRAALKAQ